MNNPLPISNTKTNISESKEDASFKTPEKVLKTIKLSRKSTPGSSPIIPLMKKTDPHLRRSMTSYNYNSIKKNGVNNISSSSILPYKTNQKKSLSSSSFFSSPSKDNSFRTDESFKRQKNDNGNKHTTDISNPIHTYSKLSDKALINMLKSKSFLKRRKPNNHIAPLYKVQSKRNDRNTQSDGKIIRQKINTPTIHDNTSHENNVKGNQKNVESYMNHKNIKLYAEEQSVKSTGRPLPVNLHSQIKSVNETEIENNVQTPNKKILSKESSVKNPSEKIQTDSKDLNTSPVPTIIPIANKTEETIPHQLSTILTTSSPNLLLSKSKTVETSKVDIPCKDTTIQKVNTNVVKEQSKLPKSTSPSNTTKISQKEKKNRSLVFQTTPKKTDQKEKNYTKQETLLYSSNHVDIFNPIPKEDKTLQKDKVDVTQPPKVNADRQRKNALGFTSPIKDIKNTNKNENKKLDSNDEQHDINNSTITNRNTNKHTSDSASMKTDILKEPSKKMVHSSENIQNESRNIENTKLYDNHSFTSNISNNDAENSSQPNRNHQNHSSYDNIRYDNTDSTDHSPVGKSHINTTNILETNATINTDRKKIDTITQLIKPTEVTTENENQMSNFKNQNIEKRKTSNDEEKEHFPYLDNEISKLSNEKIQDDQEAESQKNIMKINSGRPSNQTTEELKVATKLPDKVMEVDNNIVSYDSVNLSLPNKLDKIKNTRTTRSKTSLKRNHASNAKSSEGPRKKKAKTLPTNLEQNSPKPKNTSDMKNRDDLLKSQKGKPITSKDNSQAFVSSKKEPKSKSEQLLDNSSLTPVKSNSSLSNTLSEMYHKSKEGHNTIPNLSDSINVYNPRKSYDGTFGISQNLSYNSQKANRRPPNGLRESVVHITPEIKIEPFDELNIPPITNSMKMESIYISDSDSDSDDENEDVFKTDNKTSLDDGSDSKIYDSKYTSTQATKETVPSSFLHDIDPYIERRKFEYGFTTSAYNKLKDKSAMSKNMITDLICDGITKYTPLNKSDIVSVSNDICSSNNFQFSHTVFYQQLHRRDRIHYISIDSHIDTSKLKGKYTLFPKVNEKVIDKENEYIKLSSNNNTIVNVENTRDASSKEVSISKPQSISIEQNKNKEAPSSNTKQISITEEETMTKDISKDHQTDIPKSASSTSNPVKSSKKEWRKEWLNNLEGSSVYFKNDQFVQDEMKKIKYVFIELFRCVPNVLLNPSVDIIILGKKEGSFESDQKNILEKYRYIVNKLAPGKKIRIWTYKKTMKFIKDMGIDIANISENETVSQSDLVVKRDNLVKIISNETAHTGNNDVTIKNNTQGEVSKMTQKQQITKQNIDENIKNPDKNSNILSSVHVDGESLTDNNNKTSDSDINMDQTKSQHSSTQNTETIITKHKKEEREIVERQENNMFTQFTKEVSSPKPPNNLDWIEPKNTDILSTLESNQKEINNLENSYENHSLSNIINLMVNSLDKAADIIDMKSQELQTANQTIKLLSSQILQQQFEIASLHAVIETQKKHLVEGEEERKKITKKWMQALMKNQAFQPPKGEKREKPIN